MIEFRYDTQLLIEGKNLSEEAINEYFNTHFKGDCLLAVGDDTLIKIHYHTNEPWKVLEYCSTLGEIYDIVVEDIVILELKAVSSLRLEHEWQLINYLKATDLQVGLLLNFGLKAEMKRKIFTY